MTKQTGNIQLHKKKTFFAQKQKISISDAYVKYRKSTNSESVTAPAPRGGGGGRGEHGGVWAPQEITTVLLKMQRGHFYFKCQFLKAIQ